MIGKKDAILYSNEKEIHEASDKLIDFLEKYLDGLSPPQAWVQSGHSESTARNSRNIIRKEWKLLDKLIHQRIGDQVPLALRVIKEIMLDTSISPTVRLNAAKDMLSRAGLDKVQEKRITLDVSDLSDDELNKELETQLKAVLNEADEAVN